MKRTVVLTAGLLALGLVGYLGSQLRAQQPGATAPARPAAEPRTRIAVLNMAYVIKNYDKWKTFQEEIKAEFKGFEQKAQPKVKQGESLKAQLSDPKATIAPEQREAMTAELKKLSREIEDINAEAKAAISKKGDEQMVILYREIQDISHRYALAHNFDMVLHYTEATTQPDYYSAQNIARKLQAQALMPLYYDPGLDISREVVIALNAAYAQQRGAAAPGRVSGN